MENSVKEKLSEHVESIFKKYVSPGLHICDIATGGGKSYTIGKLTCEYYPDYYDRIIILCVQNKLVEGMNREIDRFVFSPYSRIRPKDKLVVLNNKEVLLEAIDKGSLSDLLDEMWRDICDQEKDNKNVRINDLRYSYSWVKKVSDGIVDLVKTYNDNNQNDYIQQQLDEGEANLRKAVRSFFELFKKHYEHTNQGKKISISSLKKRFPSLAKVYPQVEFNDKKVLLMTVHKAMYGIDPILSDKIKMSDFPKKDKRTLILFDESDQAAIAMRDTIIDQSIDNGGGQKRYANGYNGYLQYKALLESPEHISNEYYGDALESCISKSRSFIEKNWEMTFEGIKPYKSIFLDGNEDVEEYRRGVFFSGPAVRLNIAKSNDQTNSFVCYRKGERHFRLVHSKEAMSSLMERYDTVCPLDDFLSLISSNIKVLKSQFSKVIGEALGNSREKFNAEIKNVANNTASKGNYYGYPTLEREIHTFFSRFETASEYQFEQQQYEFMTNRKNQIETKDEKPLKLPDYSVYSQGVQLFQEEIDEKDNQHRVRLSCREISITPEKIILDLTRFDNSTVVFCSATASSMSVVSNFDIKYLQQILGEKFHTLSEKDRMRFDELNQRAYPSQHQIEIIPLKHFEFEEKRESHLELPLKYKEMFSNEARQEGLDDLWFRNTLRLLKRADKDLKDVCYQLYRLFQFIEAYHWFINHDDVHSMIFFQNRTGDKDKNQIQVLSSLIDGSYVFMPSKMNDVIPDDWDNTHIRITREWETVENNILKELGDNKDAKIMLVSAYNSFKAGTNMQYNIPEGLDFVSGDNWETDRLKLKKDWDAVYLQSPTAYLMMNEDDTETSYEKSIYNAMLVLMMLCERGCLSKYDVAQWLYKALSNLFYFSEKTELGIADDKAAWVRNIIEQAVGRLCRTRNKPDTTYILFDESMESYFDASKMDKSMTMEFKSLAEYIIHNKSIEKNDISSSAEVRRCHDANEAQRRLDMVRRQALRFTPHDGWEDDEYDEEEDLTDIPYNVQRSQRMIQSYKQTIIKKPVISSWEDLEDEDKYLTFIHKCYGEWERNEFNEFICAYDQNKRICPISKGKQYPSSISPSLVRLDVLMKNDVIRKHFEKHGFAKGWKQDGLILHPNILATDYAGEIGEEAFKALLLHYTKCTEVSLRHLEGKDYELADFVVCREDGSYKIAFDVKNMNPNANHSDKKGDIPTSKKREMKKKRLGCELITVNMLKLNDSGMDEIREIGGLIDEKGIVIPSAIELLRKLVDED